MSNNKKYYQIYNILKRLGFRSSLYGTKLLVKVIMIASTYCDYYRISDVYSTISHDLKNTDNLKELSVNEIKSSIYYAINNRKKDISKKNFENIFGFEYDEYYFTIKELVGLICDTFYHV